jgi:hypothetical protein
VSTQPAVVSVQNAIHCFATLISISMHIWWWGMGWKWRKIWRCVHQQLLLETGGRRTVTVSVAVYLLESCLRWRGCTVTAVWGRLPHGTVLRPYLVGTGSSVQDTPGSDVSVLWHQKAHSFVHKRTTLDLRKFNTLIVFKTYLWYCGPI